MNRVFLVFIILIGFSLACQAQVEPFLLLEKPGTSSRIRYYVGDEIEFKRYKEKNFYKGTIVQLSDTSFYVDNYVHIPVREVEFLADRSKVKGIHTIGITTLLVIPTFFLFSAANNTFNTGDTPVIDQEVYPLAIVFGVIGGGALLYNGRRYRLKNKWRLIVVRL